MSTHEFPSFYLYISLPDPTGRGVSEQLRGALLLAGVKPRQRFLAPNVRHKVLKIKTDLTGMC